MAVRKPLFTAELLLALLDSTARTEPHTSGEAPMVMS
jgi:hypothetical protein